MASEGPGPTAGHAGHMALKLQGSIWLPLQCGHACTSPDVHLHRAVLHRAVHRELPLTLTQTLLGDLPCPCKVPDLQLQVKEPT